MAQAPPCRDQTPSSSPSRSWAIRSASCDEDFDDERRAVHRAAELGFDRGRTVGERRRIRLSAAIDADADDDGLDRAAAGRLTEQAAQLAPA